MWGVRQLQNNVYLTTHTPEAKVGYSTSTRNFHQKQPVSEQQYN